MTPQQAETKQVLEHFGYSVDRNLKFKIRDERTPSASIAPNGRIKDFGSGWGGSCIDLMREFHGFGTAQAFSYLRDLGLDKFLPSSRNFNYRAAANSKNHEISARSPDAPRFAPRAEELAKQTPPPAPISENIIADLAQQRKQNFGRFSDLLARMMPSAAPSVRNELAKRFDIGYSAVSDRLVMPVRDESGAAVTLWKYNPAPAPFLNKSGELVQLPKVLFSKGKPRVGFNLPALGEYREDLAKPILILEGEKDCLNALAMGFRAVTLGSASAHLSPEKAALFKGANVTICYDFDQAGLNGARALAAQLKGVAKNVEIFDWQKAARELNIELKKGFDFSDLMNASSQPARKIEQER